MKKILFYSVTVLLTISVLLFLSTQIVTEVTIPDEIFATLSGCKVSTEYTKSNGIYAEEEFAELKRNGELCAKSKMEYLKTNNNREGFTYKYVFDW